MYGTSKPFSYAPGGFTADEFPQQRRAFQQDDPRGSPLQKNSMSRPSGKSIYMQRKEYSEELSRRPDKLHVRVEHLFTCELDGQDVKTVEGCVAKLKRLDAKGRIWSQEMIMEVQRGYLLLIDIETEVELEELPINYIQQTKAVLNSCAYNSLLAITVQDWSKRMTQVYMFQCEETGAEVIKSDLDKAIRKGGADVEPHREPADRMNFPNFTGQQNQGGFRNPSPYSMSRERSPPPPPNLPPSRWVNREPEKGYSPPEPMGGRYFNDFQKQDGPFQPEISDNQRNTEILNHVINDVEIFMNAVEAAANTMMQPKNNRKKRNPFVMNKSTNNGVKMPSWEEYVSFLRKIKYGLNLLGQLDGALVSPTAAEYVHIFFNTLNRIIPHYPEDLPPTAVSPLLTVPALRLLSEVVTPEEDDLWRSLGDCWNIPRSRWPDDDVPVYVPDFYDGWQPPPPTGMSSRHPFQYDPMRSNNQPFAQDYNQHEEPMSSGPWSTSTPPPQYREPPLEMRVIYDFMARNNRELSVMKGEVVEVVQKAKQWWVVRNARDEVGNVPQSVLEPVGNGGPMDDFVDERRSWRNSRDEVGNVPQRVLEPMRNGGPMDDYVVREDHTDSRGGPALDMNSSAADVRTWLNNKGFSKLTVNSLGVLTGKLLLNMTKEEMRTVCPEEGAKVFFHLQAVKSAIALASEPSGPYNGRY